MINWQPIETVPRDGTRVLLWLPHIHDVESVRWLDGGFYDFEGHKMREEWMTHWAAINTPGDTAGDAGGLRREP